VETIIILLAVNEGDYVLFIPAPSWRWDKLILFFAINWIPYPDFTVFIMNLSIGIK